MPIRICTYGLLLLGLCLLPYKGRGQQLDVKKKISVRLQNASVKEAMDAVMAKASVIINYAIKDAPKDRSITKRYTNQPMEDIIRDIWEGIPLELIAYDTSIDLIVLSSKNLAPGMGKVKGKVVNEKGEPVPFASVILKNTGYGGSSDENGNFLFTAPSGIYTMATRVIGYRGIEKSVMVRANTTVTVSLVIREESETLDEVTVKGKSIAQTKSEDPITISTVNTAQLQAQTQDIAKVLDKVEGVRIQQSGGLGSQTNISINGLSGNAIRFYYNGIPSEFLGGGFQLNTLPISNINRVEVYKGVMPANIGTDALGGGVNIVSNKNSGKNSDFSYQFGSFNTHRLAGSYTRAINDKWFFDLNANYNYSDNNYRMRVQNNVYDASLPFPIDRETIEIERFNDKFSSFFGNLNFGYTDTDKQWKIDLGAYVTAVDNDLQHGIRVDIVPFGEFNVKSQDTYLKADVEKGYGNKWKLNYSGIAGYSRVQVTDSTQNIYDWRGTNITAINPNISRVDGAELFEAPSISDIYNINTVQRLNIERTLKENTTLNLHNFFAYQNRTGSEELDINYVNGQDPNEEGFRLIKNITSLELRKLFLDKKLEALATGKFFTYGTRGVNTTLRGSNAGEPLPITSFSENDWGYNLAFKYQLNEKIFFRSSYEDALRIPTQTELFGNLRTIIANFSLEPERSRNFNVGVNADLADYLTIEFNYFIRDQRDLIFLQIIDFENAQFVNQDEVRSGGFEAVLSGEPLTNFNYNFNLTYFDIEIQSVENPIDAFLIGRPVPNIPTFFANLGLAYRIDNVLGEDNWLVLNADAQFIEEFSFIQEGAVRNDANFVPTQYALDLGLTYHFKNDLSVNFQANNVFDEELFDFISVPRPGRNFAVKVRYSF